jgi:cytochrome c oxidase subunit 1
VGEEIFIDGPSLAHGVLREDESEALEFDHRHFIWKYIFSQDHKIISKQYLITGIIWAIIAGLLSVFSHLQLGFPDSRFPILGKIFGSWAKGGT